MNIHKHTPKKYYRFQIYSTNYLPGIQSASGVTPSWSDSTFFVDIPSFLDGDRYQIAVESFNVNQTNAVNTGYVINCSTIPQPNSYATNTLCQSTAILNWNSSYFYHYIDFSSIGIPIKDLSFMRSKQLRIFFTGLDGNPLAATYFNNGVTNWVLSLVVFPIEDE